MYEWEIKIGRRIHETCKEPNPVKTYRMVEKDIVKAILEAEKMYMKEEEKDAREVQVYEAKMSRVLAVDLNVPEWRILVEVIFEKADEDDYLKLKKLVNEMERRV